jgi:8-oxo-dGTP diphosphatase
MALRQRATAIVRSDRGVLLVRDRGKSRYSLPGGKIERNEIAIAASIRELYEELGMRASKAERLPHCDHEASFNRHIVCLVESGNTPYLVSKELDKCLWMSSSLVWTRRSISVVRSSTSSDMVFAHVADVSEVS